jgi:hypothetical protein
MPVLLVEPVLVGVSLGIVELQLFRRLSLLGNEHNRLNIWVGVEETQLAQVVVEQEGTRDLRDRQGAVAGIDYFGEFGPMLVFHVPL